jgi:hypothetical protein
VNEIITNLGNLVTVKSNTIATPSSCSDGSISRCEKSATVGDGSVHQGFNLAHLVGLRGMNQL